MIKDESGQGASEYILLFGAILVIAIAALVIYRSYFQKTSLNAAQDIETVRNNSSGEPVTNPVTNNTKPPAPSNNTTPSLP